MKIEKFLKAFVEKYFIDFFTKSNFLSYDFSTPQISTIESRIESFAKILKIPCLYNIQEKKLLLVHKKAITLVWYKNRYVIKEFFSSITLLLYLLLYAERSQQKGRQSKCRNTA